MRYDEAKAGLKARMRAMEVARSANQDWSSQLQDYSDWKRWMEREFASEISEEKRK